MSPRWLTTAAAVLRLLLSLCSFDDSDKLRRYLVQLQHEFMMRLTVRACVRSIRMVAVAYQSVNKGSYLDKDYIKWKTPNLYTNVTTALFCISLSSVGGTGS